MVQGMSSDTAACWPSNPKSKQSVCQHVHFSWHTFQFVSKCRHFQGCSYCGCTSAPSAAAVHRDSVAKKSLLVTHLLWFKKKKVPTWEKLLEPQISSGPKLLVISIYSPTSSFIWFHMAWLAAPLVLPPQMANVFPFQLQIFLFFLTLPAS